MAVLDTRSGDPVTELDAWFQENLGKYGYDTCSLMNQLRVITLRDAPGHPVQLCGNEQGPIHPESTPPKPAREGDAGFA